MKKLEDGEWLCPCKRCGATPKIVRYDNLYYVVHNGKTKKKIKRKEGGVVKTKEVYVDCDKWHQYEFCALNEAQAIRNWYWANTHGYRDLDDIYDS